jgi:hypothetical protein
MIRLYSLVPYAARFLCRVFYGRKPKYHVGRGKHLKRFGNGWEDNGQEYYQELLMIFKEIKSSDVWNTLQDHWKLYQKKHYARDDNQVEEFREPEEECNVRQVTKMTGK